MVALGAELGESSAKAAWVEAARAGQGGEFVIVEQSGRRLPQVVGNTAGATASRAPSVEARSGTGEIGIESGSRH
jgi:hypothetical protein